MTRALLLLGAVLLSACAHRDVTLVSDPPGAFVYVYPTGKVSTITPGVMQGLRASQNYTVVATLKGYDPLRVIISGDSTFPWPFPINFIISWCGGYDSTISFKMYPCTTPDGCGRIDPRLPGSIPQ